MKFKRIKKVKFLNSIGNNLANNQDDVILLKRALNGFGYLDLDSKKAEPHGYMTRDLDSSIRQYQNERDLKIDGRLFSGGETQEKINVDLDDEDSEFVPDIYTDPIEREELPPPNIPGTNIPDRGVPEQGVPRSDVDGDRPRYSIDSDIEKAPPLVDPYMPIIDPMFPLMPRKWGV